MPRHVPPPLSVALTWLRERAAWTQQELAAVTGATKQQLSAYEHGQRNLKRERLEELVADMGFGPADVDLALLTISALEPPPAVPAAVPAIGSVPADSDAALAAVRVGAPGDATPEEDRLARRAAGRLAVEAADLARSALLAQATARRVARARIAAGALWQRLKLCTPAQRRLLVEHTLEFQGWALAERLAEASARAAPRSADLALELARLAVAAARRDAGPDAWRSRLEGYARGFLANALRVAGSLAQADAEWKTVWRLWTAGAAGDPAAVLPEWRLLDLEASLHRDARRFAAALDLLDRAAAMAPTSAAGRILLKRAFTLEQAGDVTGAVEALRQAAPRVSETGESRLQWALAFNLSVNLCHLGAFAEAAAQLSGLRRLTVELGNDLDLLRVLWLSGRVAAGLARQDEARAAFEQVRDQLAARRDGFGTAMVSLELAILYLEDGRLAEVRRLALAMSWVFAAEGLEREALAGLRLFCDAACREAATVEQARTVLGLFGRSPHFGVTEP